MRGDTSRWADGPFYRKWIGRFGEPALDVGCGTGRLLFRYLAEGLDVEGLEVSPDMLRELRRRAKALGVKPVVHRQAMEDLRVARRYRTIFVPSSTFQLLTSEAAARRAMSAFRRHLEPGGALIMPFLVLAAGESAVTEVTRPDGAVVRRRYDSWFNPRTRLERTVTEFEIVKDGKVVAREVHRRNPATRGYSVEQATELYLRSGFRVHSVVSGFRSRAFAEGDSIFTVIGVAE